MLTRRDRLGRIWHDREPHRRTEPFNLLHRNQMMENEPPEHARLRPHGRRGVRPRATSSGCGRGCRELWPLLLLAERRPGRRSTRSTTTRSRCPVLVIAEPARRASRLRHRLLRSWSQAIVQMYEVVAVRRAVEDGGVRAGQRDFADCMRDGRRRSDATLRPTTWSAHLPRASDRRAHRTTRRVACGRCCCSTRGHEASVNVFGNGLVAMLRARPVRRGVGETRIGADAVEEMLRFDSALQLFERTADRARSRSPTSSSGRARRSPALLGRRQPRPRPSFDGAGRAPIGRDPNPHARPSGSAFTSARRRRRLARIGASPRVGSGAGWSGRTPASRAAWRVRAGTRPAGPTFVPPRGPLAP